MKIFEDIALLLKTISFADLIFFFTIIVFLILIITLIYFIKMDNTNKLSETDEMKIVEEINKNMNDEVPNNIEFTSYEKEQEDKAIISYDELLKQKSNYDINYEEEDLYDDLSVKKVNLDKIIEEKEGEMPRPKVRVISFVEEENFLRALKQLQENLN